MHVDGKDIHLGTFKRDADAARVAREAWEARDRGEWKHWFSKHSVRRPKV